jgi:hypothetical protein
MTALPSGERAWPFRRLMVGSAIGVAVFVGLAMILLAATVGSCDAFGGRCPAERPPLLDDDVFGMAAFGTALAVAVPLFLSRPSKRRFVVAVAVGIVAAFFVGLIVTSAAHAG